MELLERTQCLAELTDWLRRAIEGAGCIALLGAEAGIGKTALLQEFVRAPLGARVLWGGCDALFAPRPLGPLYDIARQTQGELLAAINSAANREALFAAALNELERTQTLVVFEDMHWADEATLDLLKYLGRRIQRARAMLVVSYRDDEVGPRHPLRFVIGDLPRARTHRMSLLPLSEPAVAQLARQAGQPSAGLHRITGGNPFFVTEALAAVADTVPVSVRDAVLARAMRLTPDARKIAELACVVPGKTESWLLEQAVLADEAAIEGCMSIGMVRSDDGALSFRHELARRAFEDSLSQSCRQLLHAKVFAALAARPQTSAARLAHHAAGARNAAAVLQFTPLAAMQAASVGSHREAASLYQVALLYAQEIAPDERASLYERLSYECYLTGQHERAIEARREALEIWRASGSRMREGDALQWLSRQSWFFGRRADANRYGAEAIMTLESLPPSPELARAYSNRAQLDMESHELESAIGWAQRAIALAEPFGANEILCDALGALGITRLVAGDASGWADLERGLGIALEGALQEQVAGAYNDLSAMAVSWRQYDKASRWFSEGLAYCERHDLDAWRLYMLAYRARKSFEQGDWPAASEDAEAVLRHPLATPITRIPALRTLGHIRIRRGDPQAEAALEEAWALGGAVQELQRIGTLAAIRAEAAWLAGDREGVLKAVAPAYEMVCQRHDPRMKGELASWLWRVGALEDQPTAIADPYAQEISGDWRAAALAWKGLGCPYEYACLLAWHGAETEQREAFEILERLGAAPAAQALRKRMRAEGVRAVPRGSRTSTRSNRLGLTRREAEILTLVSQGMRNSAIAKRLFVSTRTVDRHVSAILAKLGVQSRGEAVALASRAPGP
ncbi:MAG TPA: AAA family ATPase [Steroidobacteraceae bacterium]|jgi:DNA-binding CsgD family transcriptional regulator/tetratricopeptide (TPR) repeat protein|nr:AAA family ATPase [Steroidobacteraceae bacterium]